MNTQKKLILSLIAASLVGLTACDKAKEVATQVEKEATKAVSEVKDTATSDADITSKVNKYVSVLNSLQKYYNETNEFFAENKAKREAAAKAGDFKSINTDASLFERNQKELEKALEMPGSLSAVDEAAKAYSAVITEFLPSWQALESYNKANKFEDDKGVKGKELLVKYNEGQQKLKAAYDTFEKALRVEMEKEKAKNIAEYKAKGQLLELHTNQAMEKAGQILEVFGDPLKDLKNQAKIDQGNALLAELDAELEAMNKAYEERKAAKTLVGTPDFWGSIHSNLTYFTGKYREARKDPKRYNDMVREYNSAIENYNRMIR